MSWKLIFNLILMFFFLADAANNVLNDSENRAEFVKLATPYIEEKASEVLLEIAQKIVENFTYDEIFPE